MGGTINGRLDEIGREEGKRGCHVDLARDLLGLSSSQCDPYAAGRQAQAGRPVS
jgi:hypothetical protein